MIKDPCQHYLEAIDHHVDLRGCNVLEIGCGTGDMTGDIAVLAAKVVAIDSDPAKLNQARTTVGLPNVTFIDASDHRAIRAAGPYDLAIYTLSLHHIPEPLMGAHLQKTARLLTGSATILAIEPGQAGSFMEVKRTYGAGSGDESPLCQAALAAMTSLPGWNLALRHSFEIDFLFADDEDFYRSKLPHHRNLSPPQQSSLKIFLDEHRTAAGIILKSQRWLYQLKRMTDSKN